MSKYISELYSLTGNISRVTNGIFSTYEDFSLMGAQDKLQPGFDS